MHERAQPRFTSKLVLGGCTWMLVVVFGGLGLRPSILAFAALIVVPLAMPLISVADRTGRRTAANHIAGRHILLAGTSLALSFVVDRGPASVALAMPWVIVAGLLAAAGLTRAAERGIRPICELAIDLAPVYLLVGAGWIVLSRAGANPQGFSDAVVELTAIHFHFAGFTLAVIAGCVARHHHFTRWRTATNALTLSVLSGVTLLAVGIATYRPLELVAAALLTLSAAGIAMAQLSAAIASRHPAARAALAGSSAALIAAMVLSLTFVITRSMNFAGPNIRTMEHTHGVLNAFGFSLLGVLGWVALAPRPIGYEAGQPFSRVRARWKVGPDFYHRIGMVDPAERAPDGLVTTLTDYDSATFTSNLVHRDIRDFYEHTARYQLETQASMPTWFRPIFWTYGRFARLVKQTDFPLGRSQSTVTFAADSNAVLPVDREADPRPGARAWVRSYDGGTRVLYAALYAIHEYAGTTYMDIAFPLPGGNVASILRPVNVEDGIELATSRSACDARGKSGDEGIWFITRRLAFRLPLLERIHVHKAAASDHPMEAQHDLYVFGVRYLQVHYKIKLHDPTRT